MGLKNRAAQGKKRSVRWESIVMGKKTTAVNSRSVGLLVEVTEQGNSRGRSSA